MTLDHCSSDIDQASAAVQLLDCCEKEAVRIALKKKLILLTHKAQKLIIDM